MRIGVFGGTFDPPHVGHLILASEALDQLGLDRLLWVLTPHSPLKQGWKITPVEMRLELLRAALADNPAFEISMVDIERPGPHYTRDTVSILQQQNPAAQLVYLMGGDSLHDLPDWYEPQEFVASCPAFGVMRRPGDAVDLTVLEQQLPGLSAKLQWISAPLLEISARQIRQRVLEGRAFRYYLPPSVYRLIQAKKLYRSET